MEQHTSSSTLSNESDELSKSHDSSEQSSFDENNSDTISSVDSSSDIEMDIRVEENPKLAEYEMFIEKSKIFSSTDGLFENILKCSSIRCGETILSFLMELKYDKLLKILPKNLKKTINKVLESNIKHFSENEDAKRVKTEDISSIKERIVLLYTERFCDLDPEKVLELYKAIEIDEDKIYIIFSKLNLVDKVDKKDVEKEFHDFNKSYLDFLPDRIEEIFFLKAADVFKSTNIDGRDHRIFFLKSSELKIFLDLLVNEIK